MDIPSGKGPDDYGTGKHNKVKARHLRCLFSFGTNSKRVLKKEELGNLKEHVAITTGKIREGILRQLGRWDL